MATTDYTEIVVILDRSGSMESAKKDHEGGLRSFVDDQKALAGDVRFTLVQFDTQSPCEIVYDGVPVDQVKSINLIPRGGTPLLDAMGMTLAHVEKRLAGTKPDQVVVLVITDGEENSSREWTKDRIKARVADLEKCGYHFLFLGAGIDAFGEAGAVGVSMANTMSSAQSGAGLRSAYAATSVNTMSARRYAASGADGQSIAASYNYSDEQRLAAIAPDDNTGGLLGTILGGGNLPADPQGKGRGRRGRNRSGPAASGDGS